MIKYSRTLVFLVKKIIEGTTMKLLELYKDKAMGAIKGLDRIRFRGTFRWLANEQGMRTFLGKFNIK